MSPEKTAPPSERDMASRARGSAGSQSHSDGLVSDSNAGTGEKSLISRNLFQIMGFPNFSEKRPVFFQFYNKTRNLSKIQ
jgi:hypothetical protein